MGLVHFVNAFSIAGFYLLQGAMRNSAVIMAMITMP